MVVTFPIKSPFFQGVAASCNRDIIVARSPTPGRRVGWEMARREKWKFLRRGFRDPILASDWLKFVKGLKTDQSFDRAVTPLLNKPFCPYLRRSLQPRQRATAIRQHYGFLFRTIGRDAASEVFRGAPLEVCRFSGRGATYVLRLLRIPGFDREGEASFVLANADSGDHIAYLTFVIAPMDDGELALWIGGLQGPRSPDAKQRVIDVTRDLWGSRPKALIVRLATWWSRSVGLKAVIGVSNGEHVLSTAKRLFDYDAFWIESGAVGLYDGNFSLPMDHPPRSDEDMSPKKRRLWRKRRELEEFVLAEMGRFSAVDPVASGLSPVLDLANDQSADNDEPVFAAA